MCVMDFWGGEIHFVFWFKWTMIEIPIWKGHDTNDIGTPRSPVGSHSFVRPRPSRFSNVLKSLRPWNALEGGLPFSGITVDFQISSRLSLLKRLNLWTLTYVNDLTCPVRPPKWGTGPKKRGITQQNAGVTETLAEWKPATRQKVYETARYGDINCDICRVKSKVSDAHVLGSGFTDR